MKQLKYIIGLLKTPLRYPVIDVTLAIGIIALLEWKYFDFEHITSLPILGILVYFVIAFIFSYSLVGRVRMAFSSYKVAFDAQLKENLDRLIDEANEYLYLISPYLNLGNVLTESILKAMAKGVQVVLVHHTRQFDKPETLPSLQRLNSAGCKIFHHPNLHAKIYMNEDEVIITSLNLVAGSFENSLESGYITSLKESHRTTLKYIRDQILNSDLVQESDISDAVLNKGYCIRTKARIPLNPDRPIEHDEYFSSGKKKNGKYCHYCGEEAGTSVAQPFCDKHRE